MHKIVHRTKQNAKYLIWEKIQENHCPKFAKNKYRVILTHPVQGGPQLYRHFCLWIFLNFEIFFSSDFSFIYVLRFCCQNPLNLLKNPLNFLNKSSILKQNIDKKKRTGNSFKNYHKQKCLYNCGPPCTINRNWPLNFHTDPKTTFPIQIWWSIFIVVCPF